MNPDGEETQTDPSKFLSKITRDVLYWISFSISQMLNYLNKTLYIRIFTVLFILEFRCQTISTYYFLKSKIKLRFCSVRMANSTCRDVNFIMEQI